MDKFLFINNIKNTIIDCGMLTDCKSLVVGVSGGADSMCLLDVMMKLQAAFEIEVVAAHLNHGLRGVDSDNDEVYVVNYCRENGIKCFTKKADYEIRNESSGRMERYKFFNELRDRENIDIIATGHNLDDRAETILMRILRGTGLDGMKGIQPIRSDGVIRPLYNVMRSDIEEYCKAEGIKYRIDATNSGVDFTRNKIRNELIPYLSENYNANIKNSLARMSDYLTTDCDFINGYAERLYERLRSPLPGYTEAVCLHIPSLKFLHEAIKPRLYKMAANEAAGMDIQLEGKHIEGIQNLAEDNIPHKNGKSINLPRNVRAVINYDWLTFELISDNGASVYLEVLIGNTYHIDELDTHIAVWEVDAKTFKRADNQYLLDYDKLGGKQLIIRTRRAGDRIAVYKDGRTKKVSDLLTDKKVVDRRNILVAEIDGEDVAIVFGVRASEVYKADKKTTRGVVIQYDKRVK